MKTQLPSPDRLPKRWYWSFDLKNLLMLSTLFGAAMLSVRIIHTGRFTFLGLAWNLLLAYLPYLLTWVLLRNPFLTRSKILVMFYLGIWICWIPNSFYILTDLFHLGDDRNDFMAPGWYDLVLILSFAWNGLILGILSVQAMEKLLLKHFSWSGEILFVFPVMWLSALGVYAGRYLRFNSWDMITNPFLVFGDIAHILLHPFAMHDAWSMAVCFSGLMTLIYLTINRLGLSRESH